MPYLRFEFFRGMHELAFQLLLGQPNHGTIAMVLFFDM